ncbi:MAG: Tim44 domain-containing protein [Alphaproteobacteria bacterium]|nr:Tim44 domain-containing protein [Alphaproteobacteria bacterium]
MAIFADPLNIMIFAVAAIAAFKLWQVLGRLPGDEPPPPPQPDEAGPVRIEPKPSDLVLESQPVKPVWQGYAPEGSDLALALLAIAARDSAFNTDEVVAGAKLAHERILEAFARGDLASLRPLLTPATLKTFETEIARRTAAGESASFNFVGIKSAGLRQARCSGNLAELDIAFASDVVSALKGKSGETLSGDEKRVVTVRELWTFARDLSLPDRAWLLAETQDDA